MEGKNFSILELTKLYLENCNYEEDKRTKLYKAIENLLKKITMNTPWKEAYKVFKDEYTKEEIDQLTLGKLIPMLSERTKKPKSIYWEMIYDMVRI